MKARLLIVLLITLARTGFAQHFDAGHLVFRLLAFEDRRAQSFLPGISQQGDSSYTALENYIQTHNLSSSDQATWNSLNSYLAIRRKEYYDALKYVLKSEKLLRPENKSHALANNLLNYLVYQDLGANMLALRSIENATSPEPEITWQLRLLRAAMQRENGADEQAYNELKTCIAENKNLQVYDAFEAGLQLSQACERLERYNEQLRYALYCDSIVKNPDRPLRHPAIAYLAGNTSDAELLLSLKKRALMNLGVAWRKNKKYREALQCIDLLADLEKSSGRKEQLAAVLVNKGLTNTLQKDYYNASYNYAEAARIYEASGNAERAAETYNLLAKNGLLNQDYNKALNFCLKASDLAGKNNDRKNLAASYFILSEIYVLNNDYVSSQAYFKKYNQEKELATGEDRKLAETRIGHNTEAGLLTRRAESEIAAAEKRELEFVNARIIAEQAEQEVLLLKKENELKEKNLQNQSLQKDQIAKDLLLLSQQLEKEQLLQQNTKLNKDREIKSLDSANRAKEIRLLNVQNNIARKENEFNSRELSNARSLQKLYITASIILLFFVASLVYFLLKNRKQKRVIENYAAAIEKSNIMLEENMTQIVEQKNIIEEKNTLILDSINYAQNIQDAFLTPETVISNLLGGECFVMYKPRDIVSGDFYLVRKKENRVYIVLGDCTGHGVPGAMISTLAYQEISHLIETQNIPPGKILDQLNRRINQLLNNNSRLGSDGMDLLLLEFNPDTRLLNFAGARGVFALMRNGVLEEIKTDRQSIGHSATDQEIIFTDVLLQLQKGDVLYLFTDGFTDQFSEKTGKRIGSKHFREQLASLAAIPTDRQKAQLDAFLSDHQGSVIQTDDITLLGIKIN